MRFNLYGGPCSGKSTTAAFIFRHLKKRGNSIEQIQEYCKSWAYMNKEITTFDQVYFFAKQLHQEERFLRSGVKNTVSDSPPLMTTVYSKLYFDYTIGELLAGIDKIYTNKHPVTNIFLKRNESFAYDSNGRYQNLEEAKKIDEAIKKALPNMPLNKPYFVDPEDKDTIIKIIEKHAD